MPTSDQNGARLEEEVIPRHFRDFGGTEGSPGRMTRSVASTSSQVTPGHWRINIPSAVLTKTTRPFSPRDSPHSAGI